MIELERSPIQLEDASNSCLLDAVLEISELLSEEIELVLWVIVRLDVLRHLGDIGDQVPWICVDDVPDKELNEFLLAGIGSGLHIFLNY